MLLHASNTATLHCPSIAATVPSQMPLNNMLPHFMLEFPFRMPERAAAHSDQACKCELSESSYKSAMAAHQMRCPLLAEQTGAENVYN